MNIPDPQFDRHELVTLNWNSLPLPTKIVNRLYSLDDKAWAYQLAGFKDLYSAYYIDSRTEKK